MSDDANARATIKLLREAGLTVDGEKEPFTVAGEFLFWPSTNTFRLASGRRTGYGWRNLAAAARQRAKNAKINEAR